MWVAVVLVCSSFLAVSISHYFKSKNHQAVSISFALLAGSLGYWAVSYSNNAGITASKIVGEGNYYEIVVNTPVSSKRILVHAVDIDGNKEKVDILAKYPIDGYKIEQVGKRTFLLPVNTVVATDNKGETFFVSEDGDVMSVPMMLKIEGPVNPPLSGPETHGS